MENKDYLIDNHTHLNIEPLYDNWTEWAKRCEQFHMFLNLASCEPLDVTRAIEIARKTSFCNVFMAIHPTEIDNYEWNEVEKQFKDWYQANSDIIIGIGECGLDQKNPLEMPAFEKQIEWLKKQVNLANELNLPVMLHIRLAYDYLIEHWNEFHFQTQVVLHCYCGTAQQAQKFLEKGCYISLAGVVTHKNAAEEWADEVIKTVPLNRLFVETDAPFLTPREFRKHNKTNYPFFITETYDYIAKIKKISVQELRKQVNVNYVTVYGHDKLR